MKLHPLMQDRTAIRILKMLYDQEVASRGSYTMRLSAARKRMGLFFAPFKSMDALSSYGLIGVDSVDGDYIMSMTNKGKEFIELFDQIVELFAVRKDGQKKVRVRYELTSQEKRILVLTYRICKEVGNDFVPLKALVEELYPHQDNKTSIASRYISKLEELRLMERRKEGRNTLVRVTEHGFKTIKEQYLNGLMH